MQTFYSSALHDVTTQGLFVNNLVPPILGILCNDVGGHWKKTISNKECQRYFVTQNTCWPWIFQTANQAKFLDSSYLNRLSILLLVSWSLYSKGKKEVFYYRNRKFYIDSLIYITTCTKYIYFSFSALWRG